MSLLAFQPSFDELGSPLFDVTFCTLDLETTGGSAAGGDRITEIGAVKHRGGDVVGTFQTLVNPGRDIPPTITILTGITHSMVVDAPLIDEALPTFLEFIGSSVIVGHNVRFDLSFLNAAAERLGYPRLDHRSVDTAALARRLVRPEVRNLRLATLAKHFRSPTKPTHRALDDARATAHVLHALMERAGTLGVTALEDLLQLPTAKGAPNYSKIRLTDGLPRRPGVYLFKDANDRIFYVGKAKNLRTRVRSYFYGDTRKSVAAMLNELATIDYHVTAGELEAEVTELRLIHAHRPRHNRRSRPPKASHFVKLTSERWPRLSIARSYREDGGTYLGPFRSRKAAERVVHAIWDAAPIRRCIAKKPSGANCAFSEMGVAACPCDGSIDEVAYESIVATVRAGMTTRPASLLQPLEDRMRELSEQQRYEDAARLRDRHRSLARAILRRRAWQAMIEAGSIWAQTPEGDGAVIDAGRLAAAWQGMDRPLVAAGTITDEQIPPSVEIGEEAHLVWSWLTQNEVRLLDTTRPIAMPAWPVAAV